MYKYVLAYIALMSVVDFMLYASDKVRARRGAVRVPEKVLLGLGFIGGATGGLCGMLIFRHKTKHWYFYIINLLSIAMHAAAVVAVYMYL